MLRYIEIVLNTKKVRKAVRKVISITGNTIRFEYAPLLNRLWIELLDDKGTTLYLSYLPVSKATPEAIKLKIIGIAIAYYDREEYIDQEKQRQEAYPLLEKQSALVISYHSMEESLKDLKEAAKSNELPEDIETLRKLTLTLRNAKTFINEMESKSLLAASESFPKDESVNRIIRGLKFIFKIK